MAAITIEITFDRDDPQTGEAIQIEAKNVVKFKAGKELADAV